MSFGRRLRGTISGVEALAGLRVRVQHLARDLRVARLIGAHQPDLVAAQNRRQSIKQQEGRGQKQHNHLAP